MYVSEGSSVAKGFPLRSGPSAVLIFRDSLARIAA